MEQTPRAGRRGLLQPAGRGDFNRAGVRHRNSVVAVRARGLKSKRHFAGAYASRRNFHRRHLGRVVDPLSRSARREALARLPVTTGASGRGGYCLDRTSRRIFERSQWSELEVLAAAQESIYAAPGIKIAGRGLDKCRALDQKTKKENDNEDDGGSDDFGFAAGDGKEQRSVPQRETGR